MGEFALAEGERVQANLVRVGVIHALDAQAARVQVRAGGQVTPWLPWLAQRAGATRSWSAPRMGEQVVVLSPFGDPAQGVVLAGIYSDAHPAPAADQDVELVIFPDGSRVQYDSAAHILQVDVGSGRAVINCAAATVTASESVTLDTPRATITGELRVNGATSLGGNVEVSGNLHSSGSITDSDGVDGA